MKPHLPKVLTNVEIFEANPAFVVGQIIHCFKPCSQLRFRQRSLSMVAYQAPGFRRRAGPTFYNAVP